MDIDQRFVDVDFATESERLLLGNGSKFSDRCSAGFAAADDVVDLIPETDWKQRAQEAAQFGIENLIERIFNQQNEGSCVGNSSTQAFSIVYASTFGKSAVVPLSAISVYDRIGSSPNSGAYIGDSLREFRERGAVPLDTSANKARFAVTMPAIGFSKRMPAGWETVAKEFRADEILTVRGLPALFSTLLRGHPVVVGRAGHSIVYLRPVWDGSRWLILYVNSWGEATWGQPMAGFKGGFGFDSARLFEESAEYAFAFRSVVIPSFLAM